MPLENPPNSWVRAVASVAAYALAAAATESVSSCQAAWLLGGLDGPQVARAIVISDWEFPPVSPSAV